MSATTQQSSALDEKPAVSRAGGSSFYLAMRILARAQREAMFEIYSFCRQVDDIADSDHPRSQRLDELQAWRQNIENVYDRRTVPGLESLSRAIGRYDLQKKDFLAIIDGVEMDARSDIRGPSFDELDLYCDRVACAVGRLSVRVFGLNETDGDMLAKHLGRALQLTNILRDIDEDAAIGRLYLPREALKLAQIDSVEPETVVSDSRIGVACEYLAERAREHFSRANEIMAKCPRSRVRAPKIMGEVYRAMLEEMISRGWSRPRTPVHLSKSHLVWIALRHAFV